MKVLVDGICFQLRKKAISRFWISLLRQMALRKGVSIFMLDRGGSPAIAGVQRIEFPSYTMTFTAADSLLIQRFCEKLDIDVFTSTYYTSATMTPQVQMVYDLNPEIRESDVSRRISKEKNLTLNYASHLGCISQNTRDALRRFYPAIDEARAPIISGGVETGIFNVTSAKNVRDFCESHGLERPYVLVVGPQERDEIDTHAKSMAEAIAIDQTADFDIVFTEGERSLDPSWFVGLPSGMSIKQLDLIDTDLATAYHGAIALLCPSPCEGCWMPLTEAMACGCPVITTNQGMLGERAGEAHLAVSGEDPVEWLQALARSRDAAIRKGLVDAGLAQVAKYSCVQSEELFFELLLLASSHHFMSQTREFHRRWHKIRLAQADVDIGLD